MNFRLHVAGIAFVTFCIFAVTAGTAKADSPKINTAKIAASCANRLGAATGALDPEFIEKNIEKDKDKSTASRTRINNQLQKDGIKKTIMVKKILKWHERPFAVDISEKAAKITDQKQSGDCWMHASLKQFETELIAQGLVPKDFHFSRNFFYYVGTLEKVNSYFEEVISRQPKSMASEVFLKDLKLTDSSPEYHIADGGEFSWMLFMIYKYGLVPYEAMPDKEVTLDTGLFLRKLRDVVGGTTDSIAKKIATFSETNNGGELTPEQLAQLQKIKERGEAEIIKVLDELFGYPPSANRPFTFANKKYSPKEFSDNYVKFDVNRYVSVSSTPTQPYNKSYKISQHGSIAYNDPAAEAFHEHFVNVNQGRLAQLIKKSIDNGHVVYFAADVLKDVDNQSGVMDPRLFDFDGKLDIHTKKISRRAQVTSGLVNPDHAMVFVGYDIDANGRITRFKVANSWGRKVGKKGYFSMSIQWFNNYVFEATIDKSFISDHELELWSDPNPTEVPDFDHYYGPS